MRIRVRVRDKCEGLVLGTSVSVRVRGKYERKAQGYAKCLQVYQTKV